MTSPDEQLTLALPESPIHGVVYSETDKADLRIPLLDPVDEVETVVAEIKDIQAKSHQEVVWKDEPNTGGWYGLSPAPGGAVTHRIAVY